MDDGGWPRSSKVAVGSAASYEMRNLIITLNNNTLQLDSGYY